MIELNNVHVTFNRKSPLEKQALKDINFKVEQGSFVTVIGSNGSGKSTLLGTLAGDILPESGKVFINGHNVTRKKTASRASFVARVFQDPLTGSCGDLTIEENMALAYKRGAWRGLLPALSPSSRTFFRDKLSELHLGLEDRMRQQMNSLSGGQRQAVSLIMATLSKSSVLLLDEHTAALDPGMADFIMKLTHELVEQHGFTTLMVTHSMRQALDFGTRTIMLDGGKIILDVSGEERAKLDVPDLIEMFRNIRGRQLDEDALLME